MTLAVLDARGLNLGTAFRGDSGSHFPCHTPISLHFWYFSRLKGTGYFNIIIFSNSTYSDQRFIAGLGAVH